MAIVPLFNCFVDKGQIKADVSFYRYLNSLEGQNVDVTVRKHRKQRSNQENRYYRGVVVFMFADFTGYDNEEAHLALRQRFLSTVDDNGLMRIRSTTELSTSEFEDYMTQCRMLGDTLGFYVPAPNEVDY